MRMYALSPLYVNRHVQQVANFASHTSHHLSSNRIVSSRFLKQEKLRKKTSDKVLSRAALQIILYDFRSTPYTIQFYLYLKKGKYLKYNF